MDDSDDEDIAEQLMVLLMSWNKDDLKQDPTPVVGYQDCNKCIEGCPPR
jgi:hypothetical protein